MILAARFGGTPWAWRQENEPDEMDIGTAAWLLEEERKAQEEATNG